MNKELSQIKVSGELYDMTDEAARQRLNDIEYHTVTTEQAYEHKDLPEGEKAVSVYGDGIFGSKAYVCTSEDLIPRKTFNKTFPHNGITITRNDKTYHIEGVATAAGGVSFAEEKSDINIDMFEDISGKSFKLITFANELIGKGLSAKVEFLNADKVVVNVFDSAGASKSSISAYVANTTLTRETAFTIPEDVNIAYMRVGLTFKADTVFNHDIQVYVVETDNTKAVTLENPLATITNAEITKVFSFPYQSITTIKTPIAEYIDYMANNAKGDTATYLTPEAFGAIGDGFADDINAITLCLAMAETTKQTVLMAKKYYVSAPIDINNNGFNIYINDIVYSGKDTAVKIHGQQNTIKIHSITSSGVGVKFLGDKTNHTFCNDLEINTILASSHGIIFESTTVSVFQNVIRFNYIEAGGNGCYGIANFVGEGTFITENNFYGGHIDNCDWAVYGVAGNSRLMNIQVEGDVKGGFYITGYVNIINPRWAEASRDGEYPFLKFACADNPSYVVVDSNVSLSIDDIDLSENIDTFTVDAGSTLPLTETRISTLNFPIMPTRIGGNGTNVQSSSVYCTRAYVWGKFLIMTPHMAYRKEVKTETLDTRLIGQETTELEVQSLSQLPTKFVVNTVNTEIHLHASYCAFGFNEFEIEQSNGFTCKIYDVLDNLIFDGTDKGDGLYRFNVYKDSDKAVYYGNGQLRRDFRGHYWQILKLGATVIS